MMGVGCGFVIRNIQNIVTFRSVFVYTVIYEISDSYDYKFLHSKANEVPEVELTYIFNISFTPTLFVGGWSVSRPLVLPSGMIP